MKDLKQRLRRKILNNERHKFDLITIKDIIPEEELLTEKPLSLRKRIADILNIKVVEIDPTDFSEWLGKVREAKKWLKDNLKPVRWEDKPADYNKYDPLINMIPKEAFFSETAYGLRQKVADMIGLPVDKVDASEFNQFYEKAKKNIIDDLLSNQQN